MTDALSAAYREQLSRDAAPPPFSGLVRRARRRRRAQVASAGVAVVLVALVPVAWSAAGPDARPPAPPLAASPAADEAERVGEAVRRLLTVDADLSELRAAVEELSAGPARADREGLLRDLEDGGRATRPAPGLVAAGLVERRGTTSTWLVLLDDAATPVRADVDDTTGRVVGLGDPTEPDGTVRTSRDPDPGQARDLSALLTPTVELSGGDLDAQDRAVMATAVEPFAGSWREGRAERERQGLTSSDRVRSQVAVERSDATSVTALWFVEWRVAPKPSDQPPAAAAWRVRLVDTPSGLRVAEREQLATGTSLFFDVRGLGECSRTPPPDATTIGDGVLEGRPWAVVHWRQGTRTCARSTYGAELGGSVTLSRSGTANSSLSTDVRLRIVTGGVPADVTEVDVTVDGVRTTVPTAAVPGQADRAFAAALVVEPGQLVTTVLLRYADGRVEPRELVPS